ncbi:MAG: GntR family transcriptional regulator [Armatimonadetes bacterium]|nr:GntR family transcriptional regulator [Armatimonadota bacterium]
MAHELTLPPVDESSALPLYYQVRETVRQQIEAGQWKRGDLIPSESDLQEAFGVSRATIRQALQELVAEGLLIRKQGRGTFVATPKIAEDLPRLVSFTEEMRMQDLAPSTKEAVVKIVEAPKRVTEALAMSPHERFLRLERVRCANAEPIVLLISYLPRALGVDPNEDFSGSLYALLEGKYGVRFGKAFQVIEAAAADDYVAQKLEIDEGDPILIIRRGVFSKSEAPVEYVEGFYRADRYRYSIRLER